MTPERIALWVFLTTTTIDIVAYIPLIKDLIKGKPSGNLHTWLLWTLSGLGGFVYIWVVVKDRPLLIVGGIFLALNALVVLLILRARHLAKHNT